jgi:hypothetical protein
MPWSNSALQWPEEWLTIVVWACLGGLLLVRYEMRQSSNA